MGPLFFRAENNSGDVVIPSLAHASMGPLFFRAENGLDRISYRLANGCFNGAALFQSGEQPEPKPEPKTEPALQWGRSFSERRTSACIWARPVARSSFNGAALFQSGEQ